MANRMVALPHLEEVVSEPDVVLVEDRLELRPDAASYQPIVIAGVSLRAMARCFLRGCSRDEPRRPCRVGEGGARPHRSGSGGQWSDEVAMLKAPGDPTHLRLASLSGRF
jgi:hypothetical protein